MKIKLLLVSIFLMLLCIEAQAKQYTNHVVILSIDGLMPKVLLNGRAPQLNLLWKKGSYTFKAKTIIPSLTLPSHTSMLTGVGFEKHGVYWNDYDSSKQIKVKTIFDYAREKQFTTAMFAAKDKFLHFRKDTPDKYYDNPGKTGYRDILSQAAGYILAEKPNLSFVHLKEIDITGHTWGWNSDAQYGVLKKMDRFIGAFVKNLKGGIEDVVIIITSDHGGHFLLHGSASTDDTTIPWIITGKAIKSGYPVINRVNTVDTAATALWLLGIESYKELDGKPVTEVLEPGR